MLSKLVKNDKIKSIEYTKTTHLKLTTVNDDVIDLKLKVNTRKMNVVCHVLINNMIFHSHLEMNDENQKAWNQLVRENFEEYSIKHDDKIAMTKTVWKEIGGFNE